MTNGNEVKRIADEAKTTADSAKTSVDEIKMADYKYIFTCTNHDCVCHKTGIGIAFTTDNIAEAEKHSRENDSPMWISKEEAKKVAEEAKTAATTKTA